MLFEALLLGAALVAAVQRRAKPKRTGAGATPAWRERALLPLVAEARTRQLREIMFGGDAIEISEVERKARRNLAIGGATLAAATLGLLGVPLLLPVSAVGFLYLARYIYKDAYDAVVKERRVRISILHAAVMTGVVLGGYLFAGAVTACLIMLTRWLMVKTEDHSKRKLANLFGKQPRFVWIRLDDGQDLEIPFEQLKRGDVVVVTAGETIPADGTIVSGNASIDSHTLTGEFQPAEQQVGDRVFRSTVVLAGQICIEVERAGADTVAGQIVDVLQRTTDYRTSLQSRSQTFVDAMTIPMFALGAVSLRAVGFNSTLGVLWNVPGVRMEFFGPLSMLNFLHLASRDGILVKDGRSLELLSEVDTLVFDKTGTLTLDQPLVGRIHVADGLPEDEVLRYAATAEYRQTHPIARAIQTEARRRDLTLSDVDGATYQVGYGITVRVRDRTVRVGSGEFMRMEHIGIPDAIRESQVRSHAEGHSLVMVALDDRVAGAVELQATIRPEAKRVIETLRRRNLSMYIISGDHDEPTKRLAQELHIDHYFAGTLPEAKAELIGRLREEGRHVCFAGDGINDAIALKKADVSVSLRGATTIATDTAQIVLMDESLSQLPHLFDLADEFKANMATSFKISAIPSAVCVAGAFLLRWSFLTSVAVGLVGFVVGLGNVMLPLFRSAGDPPPPAGGARPRSAPSEQGGGRP
jgi:heavy metal translocating P-type ATPase